MNPCLAKYSHFVINELQDTFASQHTRNTPDFRDPDAAIFQLRRTFQERFWMWDLLARLTPIEQCPFRPIRGTQIHCRWTKESAPAM